MDFRNIEYLKEGNDLQKEVFWLLDKNAIFQKLKDFDPILTGTYPLQINTKSSDLDIICYWKNKDEFEKLLVREFGKEDQFSVKRKKINSQLSIIATFEIDSFQFEIFGQNIPSEEQYSFRHMLIEYNLLKRYGDEFRNKIIALKERGYKTEPAFAKLLNIKGDPYIELLKY